MSEYLLCGAGGGGARRGRRPGQIFMPGRRAFVGRREVTPRRRRALAGVGRRLGRR